MTKEQAMAMLKAKRECIELDTNGNAELCNRNCGECKLNYEQGNMGEQKIVLDMAIKALEQQPSGDCVNRQAVLNTLFYKQDAILHLKNHLANSNYRNYIIGELKKLNKIEQIIDAYKTDNPKEPMWETEEYINSIIEVIEDE